MTPTNSYLAAGALSTSTISSRARRLRHLCNKQYERLVTRLISEAKLEVVFVMKKDAAEHKLTPKATYSPKTDVRIVKRTGLVNELIAHTRNSSLPLVPDVIRDAGLAFFVDEARTQTSVELRGERNMERIYFKAKDVGSVFESDNFLDTIQDWRCGY
ncbi:hypothetical protein LEN26_017247 [Aphanomyces euteiches]|nr:hypothetical protein LEN26_017247 [Aphanomyces euteiches]